MLKLVLKTAAAASLLLAGGADAASPPRSALGPPPAEPAKAQKVDPAKLKDCEKAWDRQRIKKGSRKAFVRACVRHG